MRLDCIFLERNCFPVVYSGKLRFSRRDRCNCLCQVKYVAMLELTCASINRGIAIFVQIGFTFRADSIEIALYQIGEDCIADF